MFRIAEVLAKIDAGLTNKHNQLTGMNLGVRIMRWLLLIMELFG